MRSRTVVAFGLRQNVRLRGDALVIVAIILVSVSGLAALVGFEFIGAEVSAVSPDRDLLENYLGLVLYVTGFISVGIYTNVFAFISMSREKSCGSIQALLATPLKPVHIWVGKSLSVLIPGVVLGAVMTLAALAVVNELFLVPHVGFLVNAWMIVTSLFAVPLIFLALTLMTHLVGLSGKPATANVIAQLFLPVTLMVMMNLVFHGVLSASSPWFLLVNLSIAATIGLVPLALRSRLTAERIVLSQ